MTPSQKSDELQQNLGHEPKRIEGMFFSYDGKDLKIFGMTVWRKKKHEKADNDSIDSHSDGVSGE